MRGSGRFFMFAVAVLILFLVQECRGFLAQYSPRVKKVRPCLLESKSNDSSNVVEITSAVFHDEFEALVESHPLDDPSPPERQRVRSPQSTSMIPTDPQEEWKWFYSKLKDGSVAETDTSAASLSNNILEESLLRQWMAQQRKAFMKTLGVLDLNDKANWGTPYLSRQQKELLDSVDFPWGHLQPSSLTNDIVFSNDFQQRVRLEYKDWQWNTWYERLCSFKSQHGHTRVSLDDNDVELAKWTAEQRKLRRKLPKRRRQRLDELQFDWKWKDTTGDIDDAQSSSISTQAEEKPQKVSFGRRVKELKEFRKTNGHCNVPLDHPGGLGEWVQQMEGRRSKLSPSSIQKLESIGLVFSESEED